MAEGRGKKPRGAAPSLSVGEASLSPSAVPTLNETLAALLAQVAAASARADARFDALNTLIREGNATVLAGLQQLLVEVSTPPAVASPPVALPVASISGFISALTVMM